MVSSILSINQLLYNMQDIMRDIIIINIYSPRKHSVMGSVKLQHICLSVRLWRYKGMFINPLSMVIGGRGLMNCSDIAFKQLWTHVSSEKGFILAICACQQSVNSKNKYWYMCVRF